MVFSFSMRACVEKSFNPSAGRPTPSAMWKIGFSTDLFFSSLRLKIGAMVFVMVVTSAVFRSSGFLGVSPIFFRLAVTTVAAVWDKRAVAGKGWQRAVQG